MGDKIRGDVAAGAGAVLDHERRAEQFFHLLADNAGEHIARAAGWERHHQHHRPARIIGGVCRNGENQQGGDATEQRGAACPVREECHGNAPPA